MENFKNNIKNEMHSSSFSEDATNHANQINFIIYNTAISFLGHRKYIKSYKPWRNSKIKTYKKQSNVQKEKKMEKIVRKHPDFYHSISKYNRMQLVQIHAQP